MISLDRVRLTLDLSDDRFAMTSCFFPQGNRGTIVLEDQIRHFLWSQRGRRSLLVLFGQRCRYRTQRSSDGSHQNPGEQGFGGIVIGSGVWGGLEMREARGLGVLIGFVYLHWGKGGMIWDLRVPLPKTSSRPQNVYVYAPGTRIPIFSKEFNRAVTALSIDLDWDQITIKDHNAIMSEVSLLLTLLDSLFIDGDNSACFEPRRRGGVLPVW